MPAAQTFHRKPLPSTCVVFSSIEGRQRFREALDSGLAEPFFTLAENFRTQDDPAFCGLSTLVMVCNALAIDPQRVWKGVWRWFHEDMLNCCKHLKDVRQNGINLEEFACLARCNGVEASVTKGVDITLDAFRKLILRCCSEGELVAGFLVLNYNRAVLGQTGTGHFSPVAAYHEPTDSVLIMDVARFKYPPHWVAVGTLHEAIGAHRGLVILRHGTVGGEGGPALGSSCCILEGYNVDGTPKHKCMH